MNSLYTYTILLQLAVTYAIPLSDSDDVEYYDTLNTGALESDNAYKRQFGYHGPSMGEFDAYGHHLHSHGKLQLCCQIKYVTTLCRYRPLSRRFHLVAGVCGVGYWN